MENGLKVFMPSLPVMSDLPPLAGHLPPTNEPLRIAVRRLRWFRAAIEAYVTAIGIRVGCTYRIDEAKLAGTHEQSPVDESEKPLCNHSPRRVKSKSWSRLAVQWMQ